MKKALLSGIAVALLVFPTTGAYAENNSWYLDAFGGVNWMDGDNSTIVIHAANVELEPGFTVGGALGYQFENNIRTEVEFAYRANTADKLKYDDLPDSYIFDGAIHVSSIMGNAWHDFKITQELKGYLGSGLGVAFVSAKELGTKEVFYGETMIDGTDTVFSYQAGAGLCYPVGKSVDVTFGYRLFATREAELSKQTGIAGNISLLNHTILAGIRVSFTAFR